MIREKQGKHVERTSLLDSGEHSNVGSGGGHTIIIPPQKRNWVSNRQILEWSNDTLFYYLLVMIVVDSFALSLFRGTAGHLENQCLRRSYY